MKQLGIVLADQSNRVSGGIAWRQLAEGTTTGLSEPRAVSLGYRANHYKLVAFVLSGAIAGLAGATKALVFQIASLTDGHRTMSGELVLMTLLSGLGTVFGPVVGALVIVSMENYLAQIGSWVTVVEGAIFVVCVLTFRRGIVGELARFKPNGKS